MRINRLLFEGLIFVLLITLYIIFIKPYQANKNDKRALEKCEEFKNSTINGIVVDTFIPWNNKGHVHYKIKEQNLNYTIVSNFWQYPYYISSYIKIGDEIEKKANSFDLILVRDKSDTIKIEMLDFDCENGVLRVNGKY